MILFLFVSANLYSQTTTYTEGGFTVDVSVFNPCNGNSNGSIVFRVVSTADNQPALLNIILGPVNYLLAPASIPVGGTYTHTPSKTLPQPAAFPANGEYRFILSSNGGADVISTFNPSPLPPATLYSLPNIVLTDGGSTDLSNSDCSTPNGQISVNLSGGSRQLEAAPVSGNGSFTYTWSSTNGLAGLPLTGTYNGTGSLDLATLLGRPGLPGGDYTLVIDDNYSDCGGNRNWTITDPQPSLQTITNQGTQTVCQGDNAIVQLGGSEIGVTYEVLANGAATGVTQIGTGNPLSFTVPSTAFSNGQVLVVEARLGACSPRIMTGFITMQVNPLPTITGVTVVPVCAGTTTTNLLYGATTGSPTQYSIDFDATANAAGFIDIINAALTASPIALTVPGAAAAGSYNATLRVRNTTTTCVSTGIPITITINPNPTITLGANPSVCIGSTQANLSYSATTGTPDQYSIDFNAAANAAGFTDLSNVALPASPIVITIPGTATTGVYSATLTVRNSATGCTSSGSPITITINALPTITLGANPSVCAGVTSANLTYSGTTSSPDQYSIDFDATANGAGFADVTNATLPASPIVIAVPGAAAVATYNGTLTVRNSTTGCTSVVSNISVTVIAAPTITLGINPAVCAGTTTANLPYTGTTGSPDQYSIDFNAAAEAQGFVDVTLTAFPASPIVITIPGGAAAGAYNATITVRNSGTTCSSTVPFTVTINAIPTITLGTNPSVCIGSATANLTYSATTGSPDQYSIDFNAAAEAAGFVDITNAALTASPIVIAIPGAAPIGTYNATLTVRNTTTSCGSSSSPISVTINTLPTITLGTNPQVCAGATTANLPYSATTGAPDQYSINFNTVAEAQGFVDVVNATLTATPIVIAVPGAGAAGLYGAVLTVRNSVTGCTSTNSNITVRINPNPTITPGANPSVCSGVTTANLTYTAAGTPNRYSVNYDVAAEAAGFVDVVNAVLPASPIVLVVPAAAPIGTYNATVSVSRTTTGCVSATNNITVTITPIPTITPGANPSVCAGATTANLTYSGTTGTPTLYSIDFNAAAEAQGFTDVVNAALTASPIVITVPGAATPGAYNANLTVRNGVAGCASAVSPISVTIVARPTITLGANPSICAGTTTANLPYTGTTGSPDQYSIDFNAAAEAAGFTDVTNAAITASPIAIAVPGAAPAGTYNATISVRNNGTTCSSPGLPITITIVPNPTITPGTNPSVCIGATQANLPYTGTTGSPDQYSIDFNAAAEAAGFTDITNVAITASPIVITIPGTATVGAYNATLTVRNSTAGCASAGSAITITINATPTITVGANPAVCAGATTANLPYSGTTGTPNQYSIDFDATAQAAGFADVTNVTLPASPIVITVPGAAAAGTYNATITVRNSTTGCVSTSSPISVTINPNPTITMGANPSVCLGVATANLTYSGTTGTPDQYTLNFDAAAEAAGFTDIVTATLPASPIVIAIPGTVTAGVYNATLTVINSVTGCNGAAQNVSITITPLPVLVTPQAKTICSGDNVGYEILLNPANQPAGTVFNWPDPDGGAGPATAGVNVSMGVAGTIHINDVLTNTTTAPITVTYVVTPTSGTSCTGAPVNVAITVNPRPVLVTPQAKTICSGDNVAYEILLNPANLPVGTVFNWPDPDAGGPATAGVNVAMGAAGTLHINDVLTNATAAPITVTYVVTPSRNGCAGTPVNVAITVNNAPDAGTDNTVSACSSETAFNLLTNLGGSPDTGGTWTDLDGSGAVITGNAANFGAVTTAGAYRFEYRIDGTAPCVDDVAILTVNIVIAPDAGTSATVTACNTNTTFNLFTSLGGTPDGGGTWTNLDPSSGTITGNLLDLTGVAVGTYHYQYSVTGTAPCANATAVVTINVIDTTPDAGSNNTVPACNNDAAFNLFASLGGTPDPGGSWTDVDGSGAVITGNLVNLTGIATGTYHYQYTISVGGCGISSAVVTVNVSNGPDAGGDNTVTACSAETAFDLFASLNGSPDAGGTWTDADGSGAVITGNTVDLSSLTVAGAYHFEYTVDGTAPCADDVAVITINVIIAPDAGTNNPATACNADAAFNLFTSLGGTPDTGGTWADLDASGGLITGNTVDLTGVAAGVYRFQYSVTGTAPCANDVAVVTVTVRDAPNAGTDNSATVCSAETAIDLFATLLGTPDAGGTWTDLDGSGGVITGNTVNLAGVTTAGAYHFQYRVTGTAPCVDDLAVITLNVIIAPDAGADNAVTACNTNTAFDLLASLGGTPDTGGIWASLDAGSGTITGNVVNLVGVAVGTYHYQYTVTGTAPCVDATAIVTVNVIDTTPDAGSDNTVAACNNDATFDLFANLSGTPDPGGSWTDVDGSGAAITGNLADLNGVAAGTYHYQYTINVTGCGTASAVVTVNLSDGPDAGTDNTVSACNAATAFDLLASLGGTPDGGGTWTDVDGSGGVITVNTINLSGVANGTYHFEYRITGTTPCVDDVAVVTVNVGDAPDAGLDNSVTVCNASTALNLFGNLLGTPDAGGTWLDDDGTGAPITGNFVDLSGVAPGTYNFQYVVTATAPCQNDTSNVTVTIQPAPDAGTDRIVSACNSETAFNLFANLGGTPDTGGTWVDDDLSGAIITGNTADLSPVAAGTYEFLYVVAGVGACANDTASLTINITNGPSAAIAGPDQVICGGAFTTNLAATTPTSGTGTWVIAGGAGGLVVTPTSATSQFIGAAGNAYTLRWIVTSGSCTPRIDTVIINFAASPAVTSPITACINTAAPAFTAVAAGASGFNWYKGTGPSRTLLANTVTGSFTPAAADLDMTTVGSTSFEVTAVYVCGESPGSPIVVNVSNTGSCGGGGGVNCGALTIFPITTGPTKIELPSCGNKDDGQLVFDVNLFAGGDSNFEFTLTRDGDPGFSQQQSGAGPFVFSGLYPDTYHYTVVDQINGHTCGPKDYTLLLQSVVTATVDASSQVDATCFGEPTGQVIINATGSTTGEYYYSIDGTLWKKFVPGNPGEITDLPPNGAYNLLVGEVANDVCYDTARVTINSANPAITATFTTEPATCNGNDGEIEVLTPAGGGGAPFDYSIDGTNFQPDPVFADIGGGIYTVTVRSAIGCEQEFSATVTFPGIVNFTVSTTDASCQPDGIPTGSLEVFFAAAGTYQAGISVDPLVEPATYVDYSSSDPLNDPLRFEDLINGTYYVFAKTNTALCSTRKGPHTIGGAMALNFDIVPICVDNEVSIKLDNVTGDAASLNPVTISVYTVLGNLFQPAFDKQFASEIPLNYDEQLFLRTPGEYRIQLERISDEAFCLVKSEMKNYVVHQPLSAQVGAVNESYPDIITGEMNVVNFNGGAIPYEIRIELDSAAVGGQFYQTDWEEVLQNANLQYQKDYTKIPAGRYKVEVMDEAGCAIEVIGRVPLDIDIYIPNIFTPNEDGMNDVFFIRNLPATDAQLIITNRWGNQVYSSNNYQNNWDGEKVSDGIYFYRLKVSDGDPITGWVEVLRGSKP